MCSAFTASRSTSCDLSLDPNPEMGRNIDDRSLWWKNGMVANRQQVCGRLVLVLPGYFLVFGAAKCILLQATMPAVTFSFASTGLSDSKICLPGDLLPGDLLPGPQASRAPTFGPLRGGTAYSCSCFQGASRPRLRLPSFRLPCSGVSTSRSHLPSSGSTSGLRLPLCTGTSSSHSPSRGSVSMLRLDSPLPVYGSLILCSPFCGDALAMCTLFRGGTSGLRSPFCGTSCTCLPSCGNLSTLCLATPCA